MKRGLRLREVGAENWCALKLSIVLKREWALLKVDKLIFLIERFSFHLSIIWWRHREMIRILSLGLNGGGIREVNRLIVIRSIGLYHLNCRKVIFMRLCQRQKIQAIRLNYRNLILVNLLFLGNMFLMSNLKPNCLVQTISWKLPWPSKNTILNKKNPKDIQSNSKRL